MKEQITVHDEVFELFIAESTIQQRVAEMGRELSAHYRRKKPLFLPILNGSFIFAADLLRHCDFESELTFVKLASYQGTSSKGTVQTILGLEADLRDRHLLIVEDIVDTGKTLATFIPQLLERGPASVALVSLLVKPEMMEHPLHIDFKGFEIPPKFVIGYGLDYNGLGRHLPAIYQHRS